MTLEELEEAAQSRRRVTKWTHPVADGTIRSKVGEGIIEYDLDNEAYRFVEDGGHQECVEVLDLDDFTLSEPR